MRTKAVVMFAGGLVVLATQSGLAQKARWVETHSWSGTGTKQTEMFWVNAAKWRLVARPQGTGVFQIGVYDAQGALVDLPVDQGRPAYRRRTLTGRGQRYLAITGLDATWQVRVEQYLTVIEEWHLTQIARQRPPALAKVGTWTGPREDTDETYEFTIDQGSWQVLHSNTGGGFLQVFIQREDGQIVLAANTSEPGEDSSWVHAPGKFKMQIKAANTEWRVEIFCEPQ